MFKRSVAAFLAALILFSGLVVFPAGADIVLPEIPPSPGGCAAGNHDWSDWYYIGNGEHQRNCKNGDAMEVDFCEETVTTEKAPTPLAPGTEKHRCDICGNEYTVDLPQLPTPKLALSSVENALQGGAITVELRLEKNCGIAALQTAVTFDANVLTYVGSEVGEVLDGVLLQVSDPEEEDGKATILVSFASGTNITANGLLAALSFKVKNNAAVGAHPISLEILDVIDELEQPVKGIETQDGSVYIYPLMLGDTNRDGKVSVLDAILLFRYLAGEVGENAIDLNAADMNGADGVTTADATALMQYLLEH